MACRRNFHSNQLQGSLTRLDPNQGPFTPCRLDRQIDVTTNPSDSTLQPFGRLCFPASGRGSSTNPPLERVSQVPDGSFRTRCLQPPRGVRRMHSVESSPSMLASPLSGGLATPNCVTRPNRVRMTLRLVRLPRPASAPVVAHQTLWVRLHDFRPFTMMNTFQFIRSAKLCLALSGDGRVERRARIERSEDQ